MAFIYNNADKLMRQDTSGRLNILADTLKAVLVDDSYVADRDHVFADAFSGAELSGTGYAGGFGGAGRKTLASKALTVDNTNNRVTFGAANPTWTGITAGDAHAVVVIKEATSDSDSILIAYIDAEDDVATGGDLTFQFPSGLVFETTT